MWKRLLVILLLSCAGKVCCAQTIGIGRPEKLSDKGLWLTYENDVAGKTDYYYTQGIQLGLTHPGLKGIPVNKWLPRLRAGHTIYGVALETNGYTPTSILSDTILYGDRPYAAALMLHSFAVSVNDMHTARLSTQLSVGIVGPGAGGEEMQTVIHRNTGNPIPKGWQYQVANDLVFNYYLRYDHSLWAAGSMLSLTASGGAAAGTYSDKLFAGINLSFGQLNSRLFSAQTKDLQYYISYQPMVNLVGYDATLQGGLCNTKSPYTIAAADMSRITFRQEIDVTLSFKTILLSVGYSTLTGEFKQGKSHAWGGVQLGFLF
jgi:lipid A 3-O-deacylase